MNSLFNTALKQSTALRRDLDTFSSHTSSTTPPPASLSGQISASLTSFSRTLDDYANLTKSELNDQKKEKAHERLKNFRQDLQSFRDEFTALKRDAADATATTNRNELLGRRPHAAATPENPYAHASDPSKSVFAPTSSSSSSYAPNGGPSFGAAPSEYNRETHALREQSFFSTTNATLDEYLDRGRAVLGDLGQQKDVLKSTQRRLYSVGNTLGISGDTIRMVERRAKQDKWIFWGGVVVFFGFCWLVIHYLR